MQAEEALVVVEPPFDGAEEGYALTGGDSAEVRVVFGAACACWQTGKGESVCPERH